MRKIPNKYRNTCQIKMQLVIYYFFNIMEMTYSVDINSCYPIIVYYDILNILKTFLFYKIVELLRLLHTIKLELPISKFDSKHNLFLLVYYMLLLIRIIRI